ncbi:MAG: hypothetical protein U9Q30_07385 [Campylobacterota bacterium]|nr:hypothetical protein [Campylobacterota bacterium]
MPSIIKVKKYKKRNGTVVKSHKRTTPDNSCQNNLKPNKCKKK